MRELLKVFSVVLAYERRENGMLLSVLEIVQSVYCEKVN